MPSMKKKRSKQRQHRWSCPQCNDGLLAPARPRADDVRRFCLPCSAETGRLVRRVCAALERQREHAQAAARAKRHRKQAAAARRRAEHKAFQADRQFVAGIDLQAFAARCWRHIRKSDRADAAVRRSASFQKPPLVTIRLRDDGSYATGHSYNDEYRVTVTLSRQVSRSDAEVTILHELCHQGAPEEQTAGGRNAVHGDAFNWLMLDVARRLWGSRYDVGPAVGGGGYGPTRWLERTRAEQLRADQGPTPPPEA